MNKKEYMTEECKHKWVIQNQRIICEYCSTENKRV